MHQLVFHKAISSLSYADHLKHLGLWYCIIKDKKRLIEAFKSLVTFLCLIVQYQRASIQWVSLMINLKKHFFTNRVMQINVKLSIWGGGSSKNCYIVHLKLALYVYVQYFIIKSNWKGPSVFPKLIGKQEMVNAMVDKAFLHKHHQLEWVWCCITIIKMQETFIKLI